MKNYEVVAQSNDNIIETFEAADIFQAAEIAAEKFGGEILLNINGLERSVPFEGEDDYYWLYEIQ